MVDIVRQSGKVRWFSDKSGYGFILPDDGSDEVFVHRTDLARSLNILLTDQRVTYELVDSRNGKGTGKKASNVELAEYDRQPTSARSTIL